MMKSAKTMKSIIVAMNTKYVHTSLSPWYLKASSEGLASEVKVLEFTINDILDNVLALIYKEKAKVVAFSCYIWNIRQILKICENLKKISPDTIIILGGPEVSFDSEEYMISNPSIDYILTGEGEISFPGLIRAISENQPVDTVPGLYYRHNNSINFTRDVDCIGDLDSIPSPYTEEYFVNLADRIVYFEASRGCPFSCSYCISSTFNGVRYFSMKRVLSELQKLIDRNIRQVKFVDRTFNCNRERTIQIFKYLMENAKNTSFHFEMAGDLFDDTLTEFIAKIPDGLFQFEIGVQTTNELTLEAVNRKTDMNKASRNIKKLITLGNIHIHLDLIAGMPYEGLDSFKKSFNDVYSFKPHQLQLGFLKLLRGTKLRNKDITHNYAYRSQPPYEILYNKYINYEELQELKMVEEILERYYNSGRFSKSLEFLIGSGFNDNYEFYKAFSRYNSEHGYLYRSISSREQYDVLNYYAGEILDKNKYLLFCELLRFDYLCSDNTYNLPKSMSGLQQVNFRDLCFNFLKNSDNVETYLGSYYKALPAKQIIKKVHFELFSFNIIDFLDNTSGNFNNANVNDNADLNVKTVIIFDYNDRNPVTGLYKYSIISENDFF